MRAIVPHAEPLPIRLQLERIAAIVRSAMLPVVVEKLDACDLIVQHAPEPSTRSMRERVLRHASHHSDFVAARPVMTRE